MIFTIVISIIFYWFFAALFGYRSINRILKKYRNYPVLQTPEQYDGFLRKDFGKWNQRKLKIRCWTHFPITMMAMITFLVMCVTLISLTRYVRFPVWILDYLRKTYGRFALRRCLKINEHFDCNQRISTPIVISNHVCFMDIMYLGMCVQNLIGFISKKQVQAFPLVGYIADFAQCIYIDRSSPDARLQIKKKIQERWQQFQKDPLNHNPLVIFPEGTVSNGRSVMEFKNGAFEALAPITVISLRYISKDWHFSQSVIDTFEHIFLALCAETTLQVKREVMTAFENQSVIQYRQRCRAKVAEMGSFKIYNCNYRDVVDYLRKYKENSTRL